MAESRRKQSIDCKITGERRSRLDVIERDPVRVSDKKLNGKNQKTGNQRSQLQIEQPVRRQQHSRGTLISQKNNVKGTLISSSNSSKRKESLFLEYQDLFQPKMSLSSSSSDSDSASNSNSLKSKKKSTNIEYKYSKHKLQRDNSSELDFISHTINSRMSQFSKNITLNSQRMSQHQDFMKGTQKSIKNLKSLSRIASNNKISFQPTLKIKRENSVISQDIQSQASQVSHRNINLQNIHKLLDNSSITEEERQNYLKMIDELDKKCDEIEPQKRERAKRRVRQTFVNVFNQYHGNNLQKRTSVIADHSMVSQFKEFDQDSQYSLGPNDSVFVNINQKNQNEGNQMVVRHPSLNNITSILDNSIVKKPNDKISKFIEMFKFDLQNDEEDLYDNNFDSSENNGNQQQDDDDDDDEDEDEEQQQSDNKIYGDLKNDFLDPTINDKKDPMANIIKNYKKKYVRDSTKDYYALEWISRQDYRWATKEFLFYFDYLPFLTIRKFIVLCSRYINITAFRIINHSLFVLAVLISILFNMVVFVQEQSNTDQSTADQLRQSKQLVLYLFIFENVLKFLGNGLYKFLSNAWNVLDTIILILFIIHFYNKEIMVIDFTVIRLLRILLFMGLYIKPLKIMLIALSESIMFLIEALVIVLIFTYFFALIGLHLFLGLFRLKCHYEDIGLVINRMCGYEQQCDEGQYCAYSFTNPQIPSHFDDFLYAYGQVIRVMIYNDWTEPTYFSMRTFHPATIIYYICIIFIAGIFGSNLIIAVLKIYYSQTLKKYEFEDVLKEQTTNEDVLNLCLIKQYGIDSDFEDIFDGTKMFAQSINQRNSITQQNQEKKVKAKKSQIKIRKKLLSARQIRENEENTNLERGIQKKNKLSFVNKLSLEYLLLNNSVSKIFWSKINSNQELTLNKDKFDIIYKFQNNPFLSWRTQLKEVQFYESSSEKDVFRVNRKDILIQEKMKRKLECIRKAKPKHYYIMQQKDIVQQKRQDRKDWTYMSTKLKFKKHKFPYFKRHDSSFEKNIIRIHRPATFRQTQLQQENCMPSRRILEFQSSPDNNLLKKSHLIYLYGQEYTFKDIQVLISRKADEPPEDDKNPLEELYVQFRFQEFTQSMIIKHNWSGDDILKMPMQKKTQIYKSFNKQDTVIWLVGISGVFQIIKKYIVQLLRNKGVETIFDGIVLFNVLLLCLEGLVENPIISSINDIFTVFLVIEIVFKFISMGLVRFCSKFMNIFDTLIICACLMDILIRMFLETIPVDFRIYLNLLRAMQGILFYRVIKYNKFAVRMGVITKNAFPSFFNLIILMLFVILIFALIGMNLFKDKFPLTTENGLLHSFQDLPKSFMAVFDRATGDDWYGLVIHGTTYSYRNLSMIYCLVLVYVLNFMTFGLVLAIILDGFSTYSIEEEVNEEDEINKINTEVSEDVRDRLGDCLSLNTQQEEIESPVSVDEVNNFEGTQVFLQSQQNLNSNLTINNYHQPNQNKTNILDLQGIITKLSEKMFRGFQFYTNDESDLSLYMFPQKSKFRKFCYRLVKYSYYNISINLAIIVSLFNMAIFTFLDYELGYEPIYIKTLELTMNLIVIIDCFLKIIAYGFCLDPGAYTSEFWRTVDFGYLIAFFINYWYEFQIFYFISYIKYLRPMRFVNMFQQLKELNDALAKSLKDLINILIVQLMVWFIFAMFGVIIYKNKLGYCNFPLNFGVNQSQCQAENQVWINYVHNFDNVFNAISTLYVICTGDGWGLTFQVCYNANSADIGPTLLGYEWITYVYFFLFQVVGSLFFMGFFTGILFVNFQTNRTLISKQVLTSDQQLFVQVTQMILKENPNYSDPPNSFLRLLASDLISNKIYKQIMSPAIFINTIVLSLYYFEANIEFTRTLDKIYYGFSFLMISDTLLKLMAYGFVRYWGYLWRQLELILSLIALLDFILFLTVQWTEYYFTSNIRQEYFIPVRLFFALRNLRILLIIQEFKGLARLLRILQFSFPFLLQILIFYFAVLFVYAYAGCEMFGQINKGVIIDDYLNFNTFTLAMITLFKCSTRNGWRFIMVDCSDRNPFCATDHTQCGKPWLITNAYFYSYVLLSSYIVLNLFVTGLVEQFEKFFNSQNSVLQTYIENIDRFRTVWCKYSSETKGQKMHTKYLAHFLLELGEPLGGLEGDNIWDAAKSASNFKIKAVEGYVHYQEVLYETVRYQYKMDIFHTGSQESIDEIKDNDKETRFRLHYKRLNIEDRRLPVSSQIHLKGNFNILQEYIYVLTVFRTWESYTRKLMGKMKFDMLAEALPTEPSQFSKGEEINISNMEINQYKHQCTEEQDPETGMQYQEIPRYLIRKPIAKRAQFLDSNSERPRDQDICFYEPEDQVNPQSPNDQFVQRCDNRLKSALKQQKYGFMEFGENNPEPKLMSNNLSPNNKLLKKRSFVANPMLDDESNNNASIMNDSAIDQEEQLMLINTLKIKKDNLLNRSGSLRSEERVGTESHKHLQVREFKLNYRVGRHF